MKWLRSWLAATLTAWLLVPSAAAQPVPSVAGPDAATLRTIEGQVSQIRGLDPVAVPDLRLLDHSALHSYLADQFAKNYLPNERESDQKELVALGLINSSDNLVDIQLSLLTDQVIGVYDSDLKALFVVSDQDRFGPAARITYAHEFDHALQDQHYDLRKIAPRHPVSNDQSLAAHALIEGDAIMLQTIWATKNLTQDDILELARVSSGTDDVMARVPPVVRAELLFPYTDGLAFVRQAYRAAGNSYIAVDGLFKNPPESTSQILHPDKYRNQVHPVDVQIGDIAAALGPDWRRVGAGVLGELDTRVLLQQWGSPQSEANVVAGGWSGDRWQLVEKDGHPAMALRSTWESTAAANDFFDAYTRGLSARFSTADVTDVSSTRQALTTATAATDVRLLDQDVLIVIAFDRQAADEVVDAVTSVAL